MSLLTSGWFARPVGHRLRVRRSTALLTAAFVGLGALYLQVRTPPDGPIEQIVVVPDLEPPATEATRP